MMTGRTREGRILSDAERTPPVGRILRRTRADELLGLVNVVRGELALVGPRPLLPETLDAMGELGRRRARVAPGIPGWAQKSEERRGGKGRVRTVIPGWAPDN